MRFTLVLAAHLTSCLALSISLDAFQRLSGALGVFNQPDQLPLYSGFNRGSDDDEPPTIYHYISNSDKFTKLTKAIHFVDGIDTLLDDKDAHLTFFAPPDEALRRPHHNKTHSESIAWPEVEDVNQILAGSMSYPEVFNLLDEVEALKDEDPDKERRKRILKIIIKAVLEYHIIPHHSIDFTSLANNLTYATNLTIPNVYGGLPQRLRIERVIFPPSTSVNFYTKIVHPDLKASNGIIHIVDHPVIPPPSIFQELFMFPHFFSTFTTALQRSGLLDEVDLRWEHGEGLVGSRLVTVFAPLNHAFDRLPERLRFYLFSPFGKHALRKLLEYHIAPDSLVLSDFVRLNVTEGKDVRATCANRPFEEEEEDTSRSGPLAPITRWIQDWPSKEPVTNATIEVSTLWADHLARVHVLKNRINSPFPGPNRPARYETKVWVNDELVVLPDSVAANGAVHVINRILDPRTCHEDGHKKHKKHKKHHKHKHHKHHKHPKCPCCCPCPCPCGSDQETDEVWKDWESWLPQWAAAA